MTVYIVNELGSLSFLDKFSSANRTSVFTGISRPTILRYTETDKIIYSNKLNANIRFSKFPLNF